MHSWRYAQLVHCTSIPLNATPLEQYYDDILGDCSQSGLEDVPEESFGRTETVRNDLNPNFCRPIRLSLTENTGFCLRVVLHDDDDAPNAECAFAVTEKDFLGFAAFDVSRLLLNGYLKDVELHSYEKFAAIVLPSKGTVLPGVRWLKMSSPTLFSLLSMFRMMTR